MNRKDFTPLIVIGIIVIIVGAVGYLAWKNFSKTPPQTQVQQNLPAQASSTSSGNPPNNLKTSLSGVSGSIATSTIANAPSSTSNWKSYDMENSGVTFSYPPNWTVSPLNSSTVGLYSPSTTALLNSGDVETSFDISISVSDNFAGASLQSFVNSYQDGWFTTYASSTMISSSEILKDDSQSTVPSTPAIAAFIQSQPGCTPEIMVVTLTNIPNAQQHAVFNAIVNSVYEDVCEG